MTKKKEKNPIVPPFTPLPPQLRKCQTPNLPDAHLMQQKSVVAPL